MANINNEGVLFQSIDPIDQVAYIGISNSWFNIYKQAVEKLLSQWGALDHKELRIKFGVAHSTWEYQFSDLKYYWGKIESLAFEDFKTLRVYRVSNTPDAAYASDLEFFSATWRNILNFASNRNHNPDLKEIFPKLNFPIMRFRRAALPKFVYHSRHSEGKIWISTKQFDQSGLFNREKVFTPDRQLVKEKDFRRILEPLNLHSSHYTDLIALLGYLVDAKHFKIDSIEEVLEQIIDDNIGLLSKLRPNFSIRPALAKKILLKKAI